MTAQVDIAIAGAGPVGMATAAMLIKRGVAAERIALIDGKSTQAAQQDPRSIALSEGSRQLLEQIGAWKAFGTPITEIHVSRRGSFGRTLIDASDYGLPALGYVCRYGAVVEALDLVLLHSGIHRLRPATVIGFDETQAETRLHLDDGDTLHAQLLIQAEGGIYGQQQPRERQHDYQQTAIIAQVQTDAAPPGRAFERFTAEGPLALLPQDGAYSMVWCMRPNTAEHLQQLDDEQFMQSLQEVFGQRAGRFTQIGARHAYRLGLNAEPRSTLRTLAIGNAAQTLHPVAGQGLNLGLRDASVLASLLAKEITPESLSTFSTAQRNDRRMSTSLTDLMARVFASSPDQSIVQGLLGLSLGLIDIVPAAKRLLAEQMMYGVR